ncbi:MAG TPA: hypothetical protein VJJ79_03340 [Candidatus Nanoarchaeia archaeon]|nr:hypothetical protein [Candidatus Nanoarchaeia archaeon]
MVTFQEVIAGLEDVGFYDIALPFILIFTIVFAVLQKLKLFGEGSKKFNAVFALVMAFLVVRTQIVVEIINQFLPQVSLIALIIIVVLLLVGIVMKPEAEGFSGWFGVLATIVVLISLGLVFFNSSEKLGISLPDWLADFVAQDWRLIIGIALFMWFVAWITSDPSTGTGFGQGVKKFVDSLEKGLRGGR